MSELVFQNHSKWCGICAKSNKEICIKIGKSIINSEPGRKFENGKRSANSNNYFVRPSVLYARASVVRYNNSSQSTFWIIDAILKVSSLVRLTRRGCRLPWRTGISRWRRGRGGRSPSAGGRREWRTGWRRSPPGPGHNKGLLEIIMTEIESVFKHRLS